MHPVDPGDWHSASVEFRTEAIRLKDEAISSATPRGENFCGAGIWTVLRHCNARAIISPEMRHNIAHYFHGHPDQDMPGAMGHAITASRGSDGVWSTNFSRIERMMRHYPVNVD